MNMTHTPASSASERAFIGAVIRGDTRASDHELRSDDFCDHVCRRIFASAAGLEARGLVADLVSLDDQLPGDTELLVQLSSEAAGSGALAGQYAAAIRTASQRSRIAETCLELAQRARSPDAPVDEIIAAAKSRLDRIESRTASSSVMTGTDALCDLFLHLDSSEPEAVLSTGLPRLDQHLGSCLRDGRLVVIGARPAVGKSALLSFIATHALEENRRVLYVSLEMPEREVIARMAAQLSGVSVGKLSNRTLSDGDYAALADYAPTVLRDNLWLVTDARTPAAIRRLALRMKAQGGVDLVCVDYLQLLYAEGKPSSRVEAVGEISRSLKLLAMELGVPVIAAAQVNRASTTGEDRAPKLSELRESGSIEQDADVVMFLHSQQSGGSPRSVQLILAKNRVGCTGMLDLVFDGALMKFIERR
ncbi:MAG: AAA family ATPase [Clostridia bacterium]|nr:AAA family ATPase [Clostridia bacterium]